MSDSCAITGCILAPLLIENGEKLSFVSIQSHIRLRLTNVSFSTSSNSCYCAFCYEKEYQKDRGNLSHIHLIAELSWRLMSTDEKNFVNNLIHASIYYIVKSDEIQRFIDEGVFKICE